MEFNHPGETNYEEPKKPHEKSGADYDIKIDFSAFILSLSSTTLVAFGEIPDPISKEKKKNLGVAKQMIDVIAMLKEKTKGNLTKAESELIQNLCSELKMKYLGACASPNK